MVKKIIIIIVLFIVLVFASKDYLAAAYIRHYIKNKFDGECTIEKAQLFITGIEIKNLRFWTKSFKCDLAEGLVTLDFHKFIKLKNIEIILNKVFLEINDLGSFKQKLQDTYSPGVKNQAARPARLIPTLQLDLIGIDIKIKDPQKLFLDIAGFLKAVLKDNRLKIEAKEVSFGDMAVLAGREESFSSHGRFSGELEVLLKDFTLSKTEGNFHNTKGGSIDIKKEADLTFLKTYLDEQSYNLLIDGFKNYHYNEGQIGLSNEGSSLVLQFSFNSKKMGKRNITINFHNLIGGEQ